MVVRHDDYWTRYEKRERETGTSAVAGGVFFVIIVLIALVFAIFGPSQTPDRTAPPPPAADGTQPAR